MTDHGLSAQTLSIIREVLAQFPQVENAVLFGSRAKGVHRRGSDIDLALTGRELNHRTLGQIDDALDDGFLPYRFGLVDFVRLSDPEFTAEILRVGILLYQRSSPETTAAQQ